MVSNAGLLTCLDLASKACPFSNKLKSINYKKLKDMPKTKKNEDMPPKLPENEYGKKAS